MSWFVTDVESDGPIPHKYSMVCLGAVSVSDTTKSFYGETKPISSIWIPEALAVSGFTREQHEKFEDPEAVMKRYVEWVEATSVGRPVFVSDNLAYDWSFTNWYCHYYVGRNPFGFSGRRIGDLYAGLMKDASQGSSWKKYRKTRHDHNPVNDAIGNAEALHTIKKLGLKANF